MMMTANIKSIACCITISLFDFRLEDAYGDYENCILCAEAILWCVEDRFEYENLSY